MCGCHGGAGRPGRGQLGRRVPEEPSARHGGVRDGGRPGTPLPPAHQPCSELRGDRALGSVGGGAKGQWGPSRPGPPMKSARASCQKHVPRPLKMFPVTDRRSIRKEGRAGRGPPAGTRRKAQAPRRRTRGPRGQEASPPDADPPVSGRPRASLLRVPGTKGQYTLNTQKAPTN